MYTRIDGGHVLIIGDLHISDKTVVGHHKNYVENCFTVLRDILDMVEKQKPSAIVFLGDLVGTVERNIKSREILAMFCKFFMQIRAEGARVFCVRGNHDFGDYPEFAFLSGLELFDTSETTDGYFDYFASETATVPEIRFHLVDYGMENRELRLSGEETTDIVLAHNNFTIQGITTWYAQQDGYELSGMQNFKGVYMVIAGHIHNPSPAVYSTAMMCGGTCNLFYVGSPTRPAEAFKYESCWVVDFIYNETTSSTDWDAKEWALRPNDEVFFVDESFIEELSEEEEEDLARRGQLKEVLEDIIKSRIGSTDIKAQLRAIPNASDEAKELACQYVQLAEDSAV